MIIDDVQFIIQVIMLYETRKIMETSRTVVASAVLVYVTSLVLLRLRLQHNSVSASTLCHKTLIKLWKNFNEKFETHSKQKFQRLIRFRKSEEKRERERDSRVGGMTRYNKITNMTKGQVAQSRYYFIHRIHVTLITQRCMKTE